MVMHEELVEKVARDIDPVAWSYKDKPKDTFTRESARLLSISKATAAIATILESLSEPSEAMIRAALKDRDTRHDVMTNSVEGIVADIWKDALAASPLVEEERR